MHRHQYWHCNMGTGTNPASLCTCCLPFCLNDPNKGRNGTWHLLRQASDRLRLMLKPAVTPISYTTPWGTT